MVSSFIVNEGGRECREERKANPNTHLENRGVRIGRGEILG
jgi:hypothetical protein